MQITKTQLKTIIKEEVLKEVALSKRKRKLTNEDIRYAYADYLVLSRPKLLLKEGRITKREYTRVRKYRLISEGAFGATAAGGEGSIGDIIGNVAASIGKETGKAGQGIAQGMWDALYPITKRVVKSGVQAVSDGLSGAINFPGKIVAGVGKAIGGVTRGARDAFSAIKLGLTGGGGYRKLAKKDPEAFMAGYDALTVSLKKAGIKPLTPLYAKTQLAIFETEDGQKMLDYGASKLGMTPQELISQLTMYVQQSDYVNIATEKLKEKEGEPQEDEIEVEVEG